MTSARVRAQPARSVAAGRAPLSVGVLGGLDWRLVGPFRGGRVVAVAGHPTERATFYFGSTGGGVWKSEDAGQYWENVSDGFFRRASVGALAVSGAASRCPAAFSR